MTTPTARPTHLDPARLDPATAAVAAPGRDPARVVATRGPLRRTVCQRTAPVIAAAAAVLVLAVAIPGSASAATSETSTSTITPSETMSSALTTARRAHPVAVRGDGELGRAELGRAELGRPELGRGVTARGVTGHAVSVAYRSGSPAVAPSAAGGRVVVLALAGSVNQVLDNIRNWLMGILAAVATVCATVGGVRYVLAGGELGEVERAKTAFRSAGFGYALAALAPLLVTVLKSIVGE